MISTPRAAYWWAVLLYAHVVSHLNDLFLLTHGLQLAFFGVSALAHGSAFVRWKRWSEEEKQRGWSLYGWFTGLSFCGSTAGALAYFCRLRQLELFYNYSKLETIAGPTQQQLQTMMSVRAESRRWTAAHYALFPFELGFTVLVKLIVLHRVQHFAVGRSSRPEFWRQARRCFLGVVVLLNALGICSNFGTAFYYNQAADANVDSASAFASNNTAVGKELRGVASQTHERAANVASIQRFSEVCALMLIITAFFTVGVFSARVIGSALSTLFIAQEKLVSTAGVAGEQGREMVAAASLQGRQLQRKVLGTFVVVFITVLVRSVFTVIYAVAQALQNNGDPCASSFCDPCHNVYSNIHGWILYTPVFQNVIMLIASPIALLVALWGMSGVRTLDQTASKRFQMQLKTDLHKSNHRPVSASFQHFKSVSASFQHSKSPNAGHTGTEI